MIEGKVLSVKDDTIEIDGYGTLKLDDDLKYIKHMESSRSRKSGMCWSAMIWENLSWLAKRFAQHS